MTHLPAEKEACRESHSQLGLGWVDLAILIFALLTALPYLSTVINLSPGSFQDEGLLSTGALRMLNGEILFSDFHSRIPPGCYYLTWFSFLCFGPNQLAVRLLMCLVHSVAAWTLYRCSNYCLDKKWSALPALLYSCTILVQCPTLNYHVIANGVFWSAVWAILAWQKSPSAKTAGLCGSLAGLTCWILQSEGLALMILVTLVAIDARKQITGRQMGSWILGLLISSLLLWSPLILRGAIGDAWLQTVTWTLTKTSKYTALPFSTDQLVQLWSLWLNNMTNKAWSLGFILRNTRPFSALAVGTLNYAGFYPIFALVCLFAYLRRADRATRVLIYAHLACMFVWHNRQSMIYVGYMSGGLFILLAWLLSRFGRVGSVTGVSVATIYAVFFGYQADAALASQYPVNFPRGTLYFQGEAQAKEWIERLNLLQRHQLVGQRVFVYPYLMNYSFLSGIIPVGKMPMTVPYINTEEEVRDQADAFRTLKPGYILVLPWDPNAAKDLPTVTESEFMTKASQFDQLLLKDYQFVETSGGTNLYQRQNLIQP